MVEMYVALELEPTAARDATTEILRALGEQREPYERALLSVGLRNVHLPMDGAITVPVAASVDPRPLRWECAIHIEAENHQEFFPTFEGTLTVTPNGHDACELWLQGSYTPPMGTFGATLNATVLRGAAESSLRAFLDWLAHEVRSAVEGRQSAGFDRQMHP
jgi:hypothetical protein